MDLGLPYGALVGLDVMVGHADPSWSRGWIPNCFGWIWIRNGTNHAHHLHSERWVLSTPDSIGGLMGRTNLTICRHTDSTIRGTKLGGHECRHRHLDDPMVCFRAIDGVIE